MFGVHIQDLITRKKLLTSISGKRPNHTQLKEEWGWLDTRPSPEKATRNLLQSGFVLEPPGKEKAINAMEDSYGWGEKVTSSAHLCLKIKKTAAQNWAWCHSKPMFQREGRGISQLADWNVRQSWEVAHSSSILKSMIWLEDILEEIRWPISGYICSKIVSILKKMWY